MTWLGKALGQSLVAGMTICLILLIAGACGLGMAIRHGVIQLRKEGVL
jgi:hypothetical protein